MIDVKSSGVSSESFILLKEKLCERYIVLVWSDRIKHLAKWILIVCLNKILGGIGRENYMNDVRIRAHRIIFPKTRIGNHRLAIETGRFSKIM